MRSLILSICLLFGFAQASATEGESRFHLLILKCEAEVSTGLETTPQSPPLNVDDPATPGCNKWEINVSANGDITKDEKSWQLPLLDINYGIGDNLQLKYEVPFIKNQADESSKTAIGSSKVGIKAMFFEDEDLKLELAVYPQVEFFTPNSEAIDQELETPGNITTLPLLLSKKIGETSQGDVILTANLGYNISSKSDTANFVSAAVGIGLPLLKFTSIMGELSTEQAVTKNSDDLREQLVKADLGVLTSINSKFLVYGSIGQSLSSSDQQNHSYILAGIRLLTDGINK